jgi:hypothetical protein
MSATIDQPTLPAAQTELERITTQQEEWTAKRELLAGQLARAEEGAASAALQGTATAKIATDIARNREEIRIADGALALLATQHEAATYAVRLAEQADRRERYAGLQVEEASCWARVEELWQPLGELTGATADILRDRLPVFAGLARRMESLRRDINYRDDFLRPEDQGGSL